MHCCRALRGHRPTNSGSSVRASGTDEAISLLVRSNKPQVRVRHRAVRLPFFWHATDLRPGSMTPWISKLRLQNIVTPMLFVRCGSAPCAWKAVEEEFSMLIRASVCTSKNSVCCQEISCSLIKRCETGIGEMLLINSFGRPSSHPGSDMSTKLSRLPCVRQPYLNIKNHSHRRVY